MASLPTQLPRWYQIREDNPEKGWIPKTEDITISNQKPENKVIREAWYAKNQLAYSAPVSKKATLTVQILTPIQVGGTKVTNEMTLPAQIGGYPCIPGSSLKGALLSWLCCQQATMPSEEKDFWQSLIETDWQGWKPRAIRFESVPLKNLEPYPLNPQQSWQVWNEKDNKLAIQWQAGPQEPPSTNPDKLSFQVNLRHTTNHQQKQWLTQRLQETLLHQGVGRGKASGFGRLGKTSEGQWTIQLTGMKPAIQTRKTNEGMDGKYRWSPQVLRAHLRGWFTRIALSQMSQTNAIKLTDQIFGGLRRPARLNLTSFRAYTGKILDTEASSKSPANQSHSRGHTDNRYANILRQDAEETWKIEVLCNQDFAPLVDALLELSQRLGGMGPGWRRPPHSFRNDNVYRGSRFSTTTQNSSLSLGDLIANLQSETKRLATQYKLPIAPPNPLPQGSIHSIWKSDQPDQWRDIVHGVCSTKNSKKPDWCGSSEQRPSGYAARQHSDHCLITIFESDVAATLENQGFQPIWPT